MRTAMQNEDKELKNGDICPDCGQKISVIPKTGFGQEPMIKCGCKNPFVKSSSSNGWGR